MDKTLQMLSDEISASVRDLDGSQTQLRQRDHPASWSIQQNIEHLLLTYERTADVMKERLAKGTPTKKPPSFPQRIAQFAVTQVGYFPFGRKAPGFVVPGAAAARDGAELAEAAGQCIEVFDDLSRQCESRLGHDRSVTHFSLGPMSMRQWRKFHLVHGRHHLKQIAAIRRQNNL